MLFKNHNKIVVNILWHFIPSVFRISFSFFGTMYVAREMSKDNYGQFQYLTSLFYICLIYEQITNASIVKERLILNEKESLNILYSVILSNLIFAVFASFVLYGMMRGAGELSYIFIFSMALICRAFSPLVYFFDSKLMSKQSSLTQLFGNLFYNIGRIFNPSSLLYQSSLFFSQYLVTTISNIYIFLKLKSKLVSNRLSFKVDEMRIIFIRSIPLFISLLLMQLVQRIDVFLIEYFRGFTEVADYSIVIKLSEPWLFLSSAIVVSVFPKLINSELSDNNKLLDHFHFINTVMLVISSTIVVGTFLFGDEIITLLFKEKYIRSIPLLKVYIISLPFLFLNMVQQIWEQKMNRLYFSVFRLFVSLLVNIVLNIYLIPRMGTLGAVYATIVSYSMLGIILNVTTKDSRAFLRTQIQPRRLSFYLGYIKRL
ncbi:polysaccharide biosynthesis C-terminal domain-containing protein [Acetoanaerobium sticklandii]|uniref:oligosaccharide flippase family protein n=1 Tax=Acetoanaerobium sticklandii TaxID=1511 RepID=UPI003A92C441